ncbi:MAG: hypothetical protein R6U04_13620 [Bacteroidales bacterium]
MKKIRLIFESALIAAIETFTTRENDEDPNETLIHYHRQKPIYKA